MKRITFLKSLFLLCALVVGTSTSWAQADWSEVYTSNVTLTAGTNGSTCTVNGYDGIKVGTSSKGGDMSVTVPAGTKYLHVHTSAWNGVTGLSLNITPNANISPTSISLTANTGIANSTPFTFGTKTGDQSINSSYHYQVITFTNALENETTLKFTTSTTKRFVIWGVNAEKLPTGVTIKEGNEEKSSLDMTVGDEDVTLSASVAPTNFANQAVTWSSTNTSVATVTSAGVVHPVAAGEATIKATSSLSTVYAECAVTVSAATSPAAVVSETSLDFGEVAVGQTKQLTFTVTPANLEGALTIASNNAKYTVSPTSIAQDATGEQTITVTATPTALADEMDGEITISGGGLAANKTVTLFATLYQVSTVTLSATNGVIQEGGETKTSITSRVGNTVTVTAVPNEGYIFDTWSATNATPASSTDAETEFTLTAPSVTLVANFIADPYSYATLNGEDIANMTGSLGYGNVKTISKDGLTWNTTGYKQSASNQYIQLKSDTSPYVQFPELSGYIQSITFTVTNAQASSKDGTAPVVSFMFKTSPSGSSIATVGNEGNTLTIDLTGKKEQYTTGYIVSSAGARIWDITIVYLPTDINVSVSSAKYATFSDHLDRDFSGSGITVYAAQANGAKVDFTEVADGIVPANTGVVLYSETVKNNVAIPVATTDGEFDFTNNEMIGINTRTKIAADGGEGKTNYILSNETAGIGFYKATASGAYLPAHRAYLSTANGGDLARDFLAFNDETTGINSIVTEQMNFDESTPIYNLAGQRVTKAYKGVVIVNGKKLLNK